MISKGKWGVWYMPLLAIMTVLLFSFLPAHSTFVEQYYSRGIFYVLRTTWDFLFSWIPIPILYIEIMALLGWFIFIYYKSKQLSGWQKWKKIVSNLLNLVSLIIILFYWMWGFNYKRLKTWDQFNIPPIELTPDSLISEYLRITDTLVVLRGQLTDEQILRYPSKSDINKLSRALRKDFDLLNIGSAGYPRARLLRPRGTLLHISTAGVYLPWTGEGHVDAGLHPITIPYTTLHELSHAYGQTDEDMCNFWALLAGVNHDDLFVRYSTYFGYWRYLRASIYQHKTLFEQYAQTVPPIILKDYKAIIEYSNRYPDILPKLRDLFYDTYLKSHGVNEGIASYNLMVQKALEWKNYYGHFRL